MISDDVIRRLQALHGRGSLTDEEFSRSKAAILSNTPLDDHVADIVLRDELSQLDGEWESEREQYLVRFKHVRYLPTKGTSVFIGVVMVAAGAIWTAGVANWAKLPAGFESWPVFGALFIVMWLGYAVYSYLQADRYEKAYDAYQLRRERLISLSFERNAQPEQQTPEL